MSRSIAEANGRLAVRSQLLNTEPAFFAEATNGVIDLRLVTRPFSISPSTNAFWTRLRSVQINACQAPPPEIPPPLDLARTLRYGWDAHAEPNIQQGGCLYDQVLRVDLPPGDYPLLIGLHDLVSAEPLPAFTPDGAPTGASLVYLRHDGSPGWPKDFRQPSLAEKPHLTDDPEEQAYPSWVHHKVAQARRVLASGRFDAQPGGHCQWCPVRSSCPARSGQVV